MADALSPRLYPFTSGAGMRCVGIVDRHVLTLDIGLFRDAICLRGDV